MGRKREHATLLSDLESFSNPRVDLEQYPTPGDLAAHVVHLAALHDDLDGVVLDLGTGTGILALAAALRGPLRVLGLELDRDALAVARGNEQSLAVPTPVDWIQADATDPPIARDSFGEATDAGRLTVLMNPPFGAQRGRAGADRAFLETVSALADVSYSIHNAGSQDFVESFAADEGGTVTHAFAAEFAVENTYDHHEDERREIETEVYRIEWTRT